MRPCLSQTCTLTAPFADDLAAVTAAGATAFEAWLTKLEQSVTVETATELADRNLTIPVASGQGGLLLSTGPARQAHEDHYKRRLDLCQRLGIGTIVLSPDVVPSATIDDLGRALPALAQATEWAASFDVRLALEFQAGNAICSNLETAILIVEQIGSPNLGVCLDAFHFFTGPSKVDDLRLLTAENVAHVQLCDVAGVPREFAKDADRVFPGEGDFDLKPILSRLREIGYERSISLELFNPVLWKAKPSQVMELGYTALLRTIESIRSS